MRCWRATTPSREEERDVAIPMRLIADARLVLTDALVTESLRRGKAGLPPEMPAADEIAAPPEGPQEIARAAPATRPARRTPHRQNHEEE